MMSYETIRSIAREAQQRAEAAGKEPETFTGLGTDAIRDRIRRIPFLGKVEDGAPYTPKGWQRVNVTPPRPLGCEDGYLFVDKCGLGAEDEPALSVREFVDFIYDHKELGYAIVEEGQFQVVIACYERSH